ncbi:MAG: putative 4-hydroxybenzoate polyprenyltransferase [Spirochaetaceae bacterium]|jgi:4-hydroxybenzoate polyprenyltransferase|nr:putative 4-hydroxybenzoate polyprenyltransferase [Spirochaetaceae bacterium]
MAFSIGGKLRLIGEAVIFRHTLFSLPFAATAVFLESAGTPPIKKVVLILLAAAAGRNAANALNRVIDADIDKKNPRTANRHLPRGLLSKKALLLFSLCMGIILVFAAALLNPLCLFLLPLAAILVGGYSFSKRFTWLCHYWLGIACAIAPMGSFIGLSGRFAFRYFVLAGAHALWVAGFDILYALQDIDFDRREGLRSIPARFGAGSARLLAVLSHLGTLVGLSLLPLFWPLSVWYGIAVGIAGILLAAEHIIALGNSERHIKIASYSINEIVPLIILAGTLLGIYL